VLLHHQRLVGLLSMKISLHILNMDLTCARDPASPLATSLMDGYYQAYLLSKEIQNPQ